MWDGRATEVEEEKNGGNGKSLITRKARKSTEKGLGFLYRECTRAANPTKPTLFSVLFRVFRAIYAFRQALFVQYCPACESLSAACCCPPPSSPSRSNAIRTPWPRRRG